MKLAVVIPYYNFRFFERTLRSLEHQTNKDFNLYIGNDASPEDPQELIASFKNLPLKKYEYFNENLGGTSLVKQWERCIDLTNEEEWLVILGDDDLVSENYVASFYKHINVVLDKDIQVIRFASRYIDEEDRANREITLYQHPVLEKATDSFYKNHHHQSRSSLSEHVFSRISYEEYGFYEYPLAWHSDDRAWLDFTNFGTLYTINEATVGVRVSTSSISGTTAHRVTKWETRVLFYDYIIDRDQLNYFLPEQKRQLLIDYSVFCKMISNFTYSKFVKVMRSLLKMKAFLTMLRVLKIYLNRW
jgi:glycosyltransferase involved in cell wall biosynthesis